MNTRLMSRARARLVATGGAVVLAATLFVSGAAIANDPETMTVDPATQAAWLEQHFRCEHGAELAGGPTVDPATQAAWLEQHFRCEHGAELAAA